MGNHEKMLIDAISDEKHLPLWINNGGSETLKSFGIKVLSELPIAYIDFFKRLPFYHSFNEYLFVHAGFNDTIENPFDDRHSMIWACKEEYRNTSLTNMTIVHGHCPVTVASCKERVQSNLSVINLDTGCVYSEKDGYGTLTALELKTRCMYSV
jgi:serine/threonine protein phosphatase 1